MTSYWILIARALHQKQWSIEWVGVSQVGGVDEG